MVYDSEGRMIPEGDEIIYVTCIDRVMSGHGKAAGRPNKLIFVCRSRDEADIVERNALNRSDIKNVCKTSTLPGIRHNQFVQVKTKDDYPDWYKAGKF